MSDFKLPEHLAALVKPKGSGLEVFFVHEGDDPTKSKYGQYTMVFWNGHIFGMVQDFHLGVSADGTILQAHLSQVIDVRNIHNVSAQEMEAITQLRIKKGSKS